MPPTRVTMPAVMAFFAIGCTSNQTQHTFGEWEVTQSFRSGIAIERRLAPQTRREGIYTRYTGIRLAEYRVRNEGPRPHCVRLEFTHVENGRADPAGPTGYVRVASGGTAPGGAVRADPESSGSLAWETHIRVRPTVPDGRC